MTKKSVRLYETEIETLLSLPDTQRGNILTAILATCIGAEIPELDAMETAVYTLVNGQVQRAEELTNKRKHAVSSRWKTDTKAESPDTSDIQTDTKAESADATPYTITNTITNTNTITSTENTSLSSEDEPEETNPFFEAFWQQYPKKVGKKDALKAWKKASIGKNLRDKIMAAIERGRESEQWQRDGGRYIPNPSTWINQGRWDDEYTPAQNRPPTHERADPFAAYAQQKYAEVTSDG